MTPDYYAATVGEHDDDEPRNKTKGNSMFNGEMSESTADILYAADQLDCMNIPATDYHAMSAVSRSQVSDFLASRWLYYRRHILKDPLFAFAETEAMAFGTWWHEWILERGGDINDMGLVTPPREVLNADGHRKGGRYTEWAKENAGSRIVKEAELQELIEMAQAIERNSMARGLVLGDHPGAVNEVTIPWQCHETGIGLRARLDRIIPGVAIVDLKTTNDANPWAIRRTIRDRRYYMQGGVYQQACLHMTGELLPFVLVFHETACPWRCVVRQIGQKYLDRGWSEFQQGLRDIQACRESGDWRDVDTSSETAEIIDDPRDYERS